MANQRGCVKCGSPDAGTEDVAMTGTGFSRFFDVQGNHFTVVFCRNCGYSEFYHLQRSAGSDVLDFFFGG